MQSCTLGLSQAGALKHFPVTAEGLSIPAPIGNQHMSTGKACDGPEPQKSADTMPRATFSEWVEARWQMVALPPQPARVAC